MQVWDSRRSKALAHACFWAPETYLSWTARLARPKDLVCLGYYARPDFNSPSTASSYKKKTNQGTLPPMMLEISDMGKVGLFSGSKRQKDIINKILPHPLRFQHVFAKMTLKDCICFWKAVPPSDDYVALGMIATNSQEQPPQDCMRCIPKQWVVKTDVVARKVWDDTGMAGRPGSVWQVHLEYAVVVCVWCVCVCVYYYI